MDNQGTFTIKWVDIKDLKPAVYNPRKDLKPGDREYEKIRKSLNEFGLVDPLVVNSDMTVIGGHQRLKVLKEAGFVSIPCSIVNLNKEKEKALNIALNKITGEWDIPKLSELLVDLDTGAFDMNLTGFDADELEALMVDKERGGLTDPNAVPEPLEEPKTKTGDLYILGEHRLLCGDSTKKEDVERLMTGEKADMVFTDPPYGVSYAAKNEFLNAISPGNRIQTPIEKDHETPEGMSVFWKAVFSTILPFLNKGATYYVTGPQGGDLLLLLLLALRDSGFILRHMLIWVKNNHVLGRCDYNYKHEPIIYGWVDGSHKFYGGGGEISTWEIPKPLKSDLHPTMKPVELVERAVKNSTVSSGVVLDVFLGSGSTLIACEKTNRKCYGMEIDPHYCDVIVKRWEDFTGGTALLEEAK